MTNPTPHGQVPEALIDLIDAYAETRYRCGGIYSAKTEAARKAVTEALSGVQALSAAPVAFLKSVIALCSHRGYSPANIEAWDKDDKWIADLWRQAESMLAASPTPPAEQQAASSAVLKAIHEANMQLVRTGDDAFMLVPYKVATVEQQAAPKAAPGEPDGFGSAEHWKEKAQYWAGVAHRLRGEALRGEPVDGIVKPPAPQQEAQEPAAFIHWPINGPPRLGWYSQKALNDAILKTYEDGYKLDVKLYTAPQPAPDCHHRPPCDECAAIAAQGGNK